MTITAFNEFLGFQAKRKPFNQHLTGSEYMAMTPDERKEWNRQWLEWATDNYTEQLTRDLNRDQDKLASWRRYEIGE